MKIQLLAVLLFFGLIQSEGIIKSDLIGKNQPDSHKEFVKIESEYTNKSQIYMRKAAYTAFKSMYWDAKKCGIQLEIISATRNFDYQKGIWENKWKRPKYAGWQDLDKIRDIMKYSSMPGTSRHHWGTDIDLNSLTNTYFESGDGLKVYNWLKNFGKDYGFYQTYTSKDKGRTGYNEEKWHWSYMPLASEYLQLYQDSIKYQDLKGFSGSGSAANIKAIEEYVLGIDHDLK